MIVQVPKERSRFHISLQVPKEVSRYPLWQCTPCSPRDQKLLILLELDSPHLGLERLEALGSIRQVVGGFSFVNVMVEHTNF